MAITLPISPPSRLSPKSSKQDLGEGANLALVNHPKEGFLSPIFPKRKMGKPEGVAFAHFSSFSRRDKCLN